MSYALVLAVGFVAGIVSGIVGTGATVILLPVLVIVFGPREAVPIMAIVALMSNFAKITSWWREIDWKAVGAYALGGVPAAALGARTLLILPENTVEVALGLFFLAMVPGRRWLVSRNLTIGLGGLVIAGAIIGFLWWNAAPARIYMGDVGALGLGAALALLALSTNTSLLLPLICLLNVIEIGSVALQMGSYRLFNKRRIFRMSPIHHHFELIGWPETTVVIRFWIVAGIGVAAALGLFYADFARQIGVA
jgi:hypothetical protein